MKIIELKKQLNAMNKTELVILLYKLYKANRQCQAILDVEICGTSAEARAGRKSTMLSSEDSCR